MVSDFFCLEAFFYATESHPARTHYCAAVLENGAWNNPHCEMFCLT
jgi:hypothetical protein